MKERKSLDALAARDPYPSQDVWFIPAILGALALIVIAVDVGTMMRGAK